MRREVQSAPRRRGIGCRVRPETPSSPEWFAVQGSRENRSGVSAGGVADRSGHVVGRQVLRWRPDCLKPEWRRRVLLEPGSPKRATSRGSWAFAPVNFIALRRKARNLYLCCCCHAEHHQPSDTTRGGATERRRI